MDTKTDQEISSEQYIKEMNVLIEYFENNIVYLEKEVEIKLRTIAINKESLAHEKQALEKYLNK